LAPRKSVHERKTATTGPKAQGKENFWGKKKKRWRKGSTGGEGGKLRGSLVVARDHAMDWEDGGHGRKAN